MNTPGNLAVGRPKWRRVVPAGNWTRQAACQGTDPGLWFADDQTGSYREAKQICAACPVRVECLAWAVETRTAHGLFGGLAPHERRRLRRAHR